MKRFKIMIYTLLCSTFLTCNVYAEDMTIDEATTKFQSTMENIMKNYKGSEITVEEAYNSAMKGMFTSLDKYSVYYTKDEYDKFFSSETGKFCGIGVVIALKEGSEYAVVDEVYKDSPAGKAGIIKDDVLIKVGDTDLKNKVPADIADLIKGQIGERRNITVKRNEEILSFDVTLDEIKENPIKAQIIDGIGYIDISAFNANMMYYLYPEFDKFKDENVEDIIIDLRDNGGGFLNEVLDLSEYFLDDGDIITIMEDKAGRKYIKKSNTPSNFESLVILTNKGTASASELFTICMKDHGIAITMGTTTYGKGVAQNIFTNGDVYYKMTTQEYVSPNGTRLNNIGIKPDIEVKNPEFISKIDSKYYLGDKSDNIIVIKNILRYLGYNSPDMSNVYDQTTFESVQKFQADVGLGTYGGLDFTTQNAINLTYYNCLENDDRLLDEAVKYIKNNRGKNEE